MKISFKVLTSLSTVSKKGLPPFVPEKGVMTCVIIKYLEKIISFYLDRIICLPNFLLTE